MEELRFWRIYSRKKIIDIRSKAYAYFERCLRKLNRIENKDTKRKFAWNL